MTSNLMKSTDSADLRLLLLRSGLSCELGRLELQLLDRGIGAEIYILEGIGTPQRIAKVPPIAGDGDHLRLDETSIPLFREIWALQLLFGSPYINRAEGVYFIDGIPVLVFRRRDTTLRDVMKNDVLADTFERLIVLYMIANGLMWAKGRKIFLHQDLKPENILIDFLSTKYHNADQLSFTIYPRINDFGLANAVIDLDRRGGFRPYLPAEAYTRSQPITPDNRWDIYSLGVIAHELLTAGHHPMGVHMSEYIPTFTPAYKNENHWKAWARDGKRRGTPPEISDLGLRHMLAKCFAATWQDRPTLQEFACEVEAAARRQDSARWESAMFTISWLENAYKEVTPVERRFAASSEKILKEHWPALPKAKAR